MKKFLVFLISLLLFQSAIEASAEVNHCPGMHISFELDLLNWKEVNLLVPKYTVFNVIDIESGQSFQVQRRAGRDHTDVQPLTDKDTRIMKEIYGGKWSWKRRSILVQVNDYLIPGSMHGMPHGAGALQNNFPGHFCIHFFGSTTHSSDVMDYSHKLMILKSAGLLDNYVADASLQEQIKIFIEALNQKDKSILELVLTEGWIRNRDLIHFVEDIETIKIKHLPSVPSKSKQLLVTHVPIEVDMYTKKDGKVKGHLLLQLSRSSHIGQWKVHHELIKFVELN
ncbi:hypothetical protein ACOI1C_09765 [Bacillus sp. DJP31]|uniref:hypothetical protein n=1 Tax=Bacillus sp. DJP31 TaxID=3409789 RepID=UPI003BB4AA27